MVLLLDLYETLARADMDGIWAGRAAFAERAGIPRAALSAAYDKTFPARNRGRLGGLSGDLTEVLETAGLHPTPTLVAEAMDLEVRLWTELVTLYDDVLPCLDELRARGVRTALVSNCSAQTRPTVDSWGLDRHMDAVLLSCEVGLAKPDAEFFRLALERIDGRADEATFVDDMAEYLDAAAGLGIATRRVFRSSAPEPGGHAPITSLYDLL